MDGAYVSGMQSVLNDVSGVLVSVRYGCWWCMVHCVLLMFGVVLVLQLYW